MRKVVLAIVYIFFVSVCMAQNFSGTPLTDFQPGQLYLGAFPGFS